ncbi:MAG: hypothetical protein GXP09_10380 [Gammaproteobacteria bacterium]|nr:hypothetical protein [Gammaproteobacteria bacterium]
MSVAKKISGFALATAAAAMFAGAPMMASAAEADGATIHCMGVNACKGKSSCKTASSACKGQNSCKGKGYVKVSKETCDQLGGEVGKH